MKYILLKDLPNVNAGAILKSDGVNYRCQDKNNLPAVLNKRLVESNPDWFAVTENLSVIRNSMRWNDSERVTVLQFYVNGYVNPLCLDKIKNKIVGIVNHQ